MRMIKKESSCILVHTWEKERFFVYVCRKGMEKWHINTSMYLLQHYVVQPHVISFYGNLEWELHPVAAGNRPVHSVPGMKLKQLKDIFTESHRNACHKIGPVDGLTDS